MPTDDEGVPRLFVTAPADRAGLVFFLSKPQLVIGHSETADVVLEDRFVSRRHALLTVDESGVVTIQDLNSTGGTFVNSERLEGPRVLHAGDTIRFADLVARFEPASSPVPGSQVNNAPVAGLSRTAETQVLAGPAGAGPAEAGPAEAGAGQAAGQDPPATGPAGAGPATPRPEIFVGPGATYTVAGRALSPALPGIAGLAVQLVDKNVGGDQVLAATQTTSTGSYSFEQVISERYLADHHKTSPDLQVQILSGGSVLASSQVSYSAPATQSVDVVLPDGAAGLPSEYETLTANLATAYPGSLGALQENALRQDITYLANKTGWDARAVALGALADQFSQITAAAPVTGADPNATLVYPLPTVAVRPEFYYALFRAGVPADQASLFRTTPATARAIWEQAITDGVIPQALAKEVPAATTSFLTISSAQMLDAAPPVGLSTMRQMLAQTLPDQAQQTEFAKIYGELQDDLPSFWAAVEQAFGTDAAAQLKLTGQLYYLTVNNEPLVSALTTAGANGSAITSTLDLVGRGLYTESAWTPLIGTSVPPQIPGDTPAEQAANYASLLAAQVRLTYPTAVAADQVGRGILPVAGPDEVRQAVQDFLTGNQADFVIGAEPIDAFIARTGQSDVPPTTISAVKRVQRAYQLTQDDASMSVLLEHNLDSAYAITRFDSAGFVRAFSEQLGGVGVAAGIHARARQVFATTMGLAVAYVSGRVASPWGGRVPVQLGLPPQAAPVSFPVTAYPTLEDLFGSLDYCDCSDCGSILSPAAYLVDLLDYIDQPAPSGGLSNPLDVLLGRRPDLQYLPLSCANTNTALPYIDVVNELLEYVVASDFKIDGYQGYDTPETITSAELIASPQNVNDEAYAVLRAAYFPPPLPFDRPLELLRSHLARLGVTLPAAMATLRPDDDLANTSTPVSYGWTDILIEQLTISRDEYLIFTDSSLQLADLYGLPASPPPLDTLQATSLAEFSRRLGLSYDDLTSIISTTFVNPNAALIERLQQLNASFLTLQQLKETAGTPNSIAAEFIAALPAGLDATQYGGTDPTDYLAVVDWVTSDANYDNIMAIIVITDPSGDTTDCSGATLQFRYANPDNSANTLSGTDFLKLIRFIRLWQKFAPLLGDSDDATTIQQTDDILGALYPAASLPVDPSENANDTANRTRLDAGFTALLPRAGVLFSLLNTLGLGGDDGLGQLLACWAPIGTAGADSLYDQMFLSPALLQQDPGAQTATVAAAVNAGDVLHTQINGVTAIPDYTVQPGQAAPAVAAAIAQAINASTVTDPVSGEQIGQRFLATARPGSGVISIEAGFNLGCTVTPAGATETYTAAATSPLSQSGTAGGQARAGDTVVTTINGVQVGYQVADGDTTQTIAAGIAAAVNATTTPDPYSGQPLNGLVVAAQSATDPNTVDFVAADAAAPFTLACSLTPANAGTYTPAPPVPTSVTTATATVAGTFAANTTLTTTVNTVAFSYLTAQADTPATIAAAIAASVSNSNQIDPVTGLPLTSVVTISASGGVLTFTAVTPTTPFTLDATMSASGYTTGRATPPFADNGYGQFLTDTSQTVFGHEPTLCAAFNLTSAEFGLITAALGFDPSTTLTLGAISQIFRFGWLAHTLGLSVLEFIWLRQWAGLDPFGPLDPSPAPPAEPQVIRFISLLRLLQTVGLTTSQALYLMWNQDITGTSAPPLTTITGLAFALAADFASVQAQFALQADPDGAIAQNLMTLVYGTSASAFFFGLLNGTFTTSVPYSLPGGETALPQQVTDASAGRLSCDNLAKQLTFAGVLTGPAVTAIDAAVTASAPDAGPLTSAVAALALANAQQLGPFFATYPELAPLYASYASSSGSAQDKNNALLASFLPTLKSKRKQEEAQAAVTAAAGVDPSFAAALLGDPATMHADASVSAPAIADLVAIENQGLSARFFLGGDLSSSPDLAVDAVPVLSYFQTVTLAGSPATGDVLKTTINGQDIGYPVEAADGSLPVLANSLVSTINTATITDPVSGLPLSQVVTATALPPDASGNVVITVAGIDPSGTNGSFTLAASVTGGGSEQYTAGSQLPAGNGGGAIAAIWTGYLTAPQDGLYDLDVIADPGATVTLELGGQQVPMAQATTAAPWSNQAPITLTAGALVPVTLTATSVKTTFSVSWASQGTGWQPIGTPNLFPFTLMNSLGNTYVRFLKVTSLATALSLTATEISYLGTSIGGGWLNSLIGSGWLTGAPAQPGPDPATAALLTGVLTDLASFARMKHALSPSDQRLLAVLRNPGASLPVSTATSQPPPSMLPVTSSALLSLTGWNLANVNALLTQFFGSLDPANLASIENLSRVFDAYALVSTCGLAAAVLISAITNAPTPDTVSALESALRAQFATADWLTVIGPINDQARMSQRDALVAYILQRLGDSYAASLASLNITALAATGAATLTFAPTTAVTSGMAVTATAIPPGTTVGGVTNSATATTITLSSPIVTAMPAGSLVTFEPIDSAVVTDADSLYEYFLIDTQNEPAVLTSRILLAGLTVQLFIERIVRNLESSVSPADIDQSQWTWMKRYRVWQANREVFLWPENWLYPELRDDQSPFFTEVMSGLLQGDITDDAAASAYLTYLTDLEEVAKLEPCGMYYVAATADTDERCCVISRTAGARRKYYYRELTSGSWTAWTQVRIECEDMPVTPMMWNGRLFLFWLKVTKQSQPASSQLATTNSNSSDIASLQVNDLNTFQNQARDNGGSQSVSASAVLYWSEFYNGTWQPTKTSDPNLPTSLGANFDASGANSLESCRNLIGIVPAQCTGTNPASEGLSFPLPDDALMVAITVNGQSNYVGGFILHNTHSLPVRIDDIYLRNPHKIKAHVPIHPIPLVSALDQPDPSRSFAPSITPPYTGGPESDDFSISYASATLAQPVSPGNLLSLRWKPRCLQPQPWLADPWGAPFIYEDRRHLFYVVTTEIWKTLNDGIGFGALSASLGLPQVPEIPPLILRDTVAAGTPREILAVNAAVADPAAVQRYIAGQTDLTAALATQSPISYQGQVITPVGSLVTVTPPPQNFDHANPARVNPGAEGEDA